uniref:Ribosome-inactivating protein n=1 Tax=Vernicia fordii TaxID=73154 RepID=A0A4D6U1B4_VERFO|nr:RIP6 [Vernicia fordii]
MKMWVVAQTWLFWTILLGLASVYLLEAKDDEYTVDYPKLHFPIEGATRDSYTSFIEDLRARLRSGEKRHKISLLRDQSTLPDSQRFLFVEFSNCERYSATFALDISNVNVVAYRVKNQSYFFCDAPHPASYNLFKGTQRIHLSFGSSFVELEKAAGQIRKYVELGIIPLERAISSLNIVEKPDNQARSLLVVIQMISEAARFRYIELQVRKSITRKERFYPDPIMVSLEDNWVALSREIQQSFQGVFGKVVTLQTLNSQILIVDRVSPSIIANLALMLFICKSPPTSLFPLLIRPVVPNYDYPHPCVISEPTVRIIGQDNLCVDVKYQVYTEGNEIQLYPCKNYIVANQLWTLKKDGTIRSNGMCLTTHAFRPASKIIISKCSVTDAIRWQVIDDGTIKNPRSGLVLSSTGKSYSTLTLETNVNSTSQSWLPTNNSKPFVTSIVGFMDLCLQTNGKDGLQLKECSSGKKAEQEWAIYPDGTIRPHQNEKYCITCDEHVHGAAVILESCERPSSARRWVFKNDGTVVNLLTRMVMEAKQYSNPKVPEIIISVLTGKPNQKWLPLL